MYNKTNVTLCCVKLNEVDFTQRLFCTRSDCTYIVEVIKIKKNICLYVNSIRSYVNLVHVCYCLKIIVKISGKNEDYIAFRYRK